MTDRPSETRVSAAHVAISEFTGASQKAREFVAMLDAVLPLMPPRPMSDAGWALLETLAASVAGYSGPIRKALDAAHASRAERQPTTPSGNARREDHGGPIVRADPDRRQSPTESEVMPNSTRSGHVGSKDTTKPPSMAAGAVDPKTWDGGERREKQRRVKAMAGEHLPARRVGEDRRQPPPPDWKQDAAETSRVMPAKSPAPPKAGWTEEEIEALAQMAREMWKHEATFQMIVKAILSSPAVQSLRDRAETFRIRMEIAEDNLTKVCIQRDQANAELAATSKWLGELLAIIHRDGGHYSQERGWQKSVNDAHLIWADLIGKAEELAALQSRPEGRVVTAEALQDAMQFIAGKGLKVELNDARRVLELLGPILAPERPAMPSAEELAKLLVEALFGPSAWESPAFTQAIWIKASEFCLSRLSATSAEPSADEAPEIIRLRSALDAARETMRTVNGLVQMSAVSTRSSRAPCGGCSTCFAVLVGDFVQVTGGGNCTTAAAREAMGIDWMNKKELNEAIPPAYARFVGEQLMAYLTRHAIEEVKP